MKKIALLIAAVLSLSMIFTACGNKVDDSASGAESSVTSTVTDANGEVVTNSTDESGDESSAAQVDVTTAPDDVEIIDGNTTTTTTAVQQFTKVRFAYSSLTEKEKKRYEDIMNAVSNFQSQVTFDEALTFDEYFKVFALVYFQEPQLFWMRGTFEEFSGTQQTMILNYYCTKEEAATKQKEIDAAVAKIKGMLPAGATTQDKLKIFHDYVVLNNAFTKEGTYPQTIYGGLVEGSVQCEGYAKTIGYLCDQFGIENMLKTGMNVKQASHAWNIVKVDGDWYNYDTTFDDPVGNFPSDYIRYNYFLVTDADIYNKSHFEGTILYNPPKCTATKANYFVANGLVANSKDAALTMIKDEMTKAANAKQKYVQIRVTSEQILNDVNTELVTNKKIFDYQNEISKTARNSFKITGAPALDKGVLTIQITLNY